MAGSSVGEVKLKTPLAIGDKHTKGVLALITGNQFVDGTELLPVALGVTTAIHGDLKVTYRLRAGGYGLEIRCGGWRILWHRCSVVSRLWRYAGDGIVYFFADDLRAIAFSDLYFAAHYDHSFCLPQLARFFVGAREDDHFDSSLYVFQFDEGHRLAILGIDLTYPVDHAGHSHFLPCHSLINLT